MMQKMVCGPVVEKLETQSSPTVPLPEADVEPSMVWRPNEHHQLPSGAAASLRKVQAPQLEQRRVPERLCCPRCHSTNTKFVYYNNYSLRQPRFLCKTCRRYWTKGGALRFVPVGGRSRQPTAEPEAEEDHAALSLTLQSVVKEPPAKPIVPASTLAAALHLQRSLTVDAAARAPLRCPRCNSSNTKFSYYNNYNINQPRHFCRTCRRFWTKGGDIKNVPVGGGSRKRRPKPTPAAANPLACRNVVPGGLQFMGAIDNGSCTPLVHDSPTTFMDLLTGGGSILNFLGLDDKTELPAKPPPRTSYGDNAAAVPPVLHHSRVHVGAVRQQSMATPSSSSSADIYHTAPLGAFVSMTGSELSASGRVQLQHGGSLGSMVPSSSEVTVAAPGYGGGGQLPLVSSVDEPMSQYLFGGAKEMAHGWPGIPGQSVRFP